MKIKTIYQTIISLVVAAMLLTGCSGGGGGGGDSAGGASPAASYSVTASAGAGGTITPDSQTVSSGSTASITITPDAGYGISSITGCNGTLNGSTYTTAAITGDCAVEATFVAGTTVLYNIQASARPGGSVTGGGTFSSGTWITLTAIAADGYRFDHWTIDGVDGSSTSSTTKTVIVTKDQSYVANFIADTYVIAAAAQTSGGTITPASQTVPNGNYAKLTVTPGAGYAIDKVERSVGCYIGLQGSGNTYIAGPVDEDCGISATFKNTALVTTAVGTNGGTISPNQMVAIGSKGVITLSANTGYYISKVVGCNGTLSGNTYTTGTITGDCSVYASFSTTAPMLYTITVSASPATGGKVSGGGVYSYVNTWDQADVSAQPYIHDYAFVNWTENGVEVSKQASYRFTPTANRNLVANFVPLSSLPTHVVSVSAANSTFQLFNTKATTFTVPEGVEQKFDIVTQPHYKLTSVSGCGANWLTGANWYTVRVFSDCTITATTVPTYTIGGTLSGLTQYSGLVYVDLTLNPEANGGYGETSRSLFYYQNGTYTFDTEKVSGATYDVVITKQPNHQRCTVANASGTVTSSNITNIDVVCAFSAGGTVSGLVPGATGLTLRNGTTTLPISGNGEFFFPNLADGESFSIEVDTQPTSTPSQSCTVTNGTGVISGISATNVQVTCPAPWKKVSSSRSSLDTDGHTLAIKADGSLWAWGKNTDGQLGDNTTIDKLSPTQIGTATDWADVAAGSRHSVAIKTNGTLWAWGADDRSQLGDGTLSLTDTLVPKQIGLITTWKSVVAGYSFTLAMRSDNSLYGWGDNAEYQLCHTNAQLLNYAASPTQITGSYAGVAAGANHSLFIKTDGTLWACGANDYGQIGIGTSGASANATVLTKIGVDTNWSRVSAGLGHSAAIKTDGTLWSWGDNAYGQLGDGTTVDKLTPSLILGTGWVDLGAGENHNVAIKADGTLWTWGLNANGELGDGTTTNALSPIQIGTDTNWSSAAPGTKRTFALKTDGTLAAWGENYYGQLGIGTSGELQNRLTPALVDSANWQELSAGYDHSIAVAADGTLWAWGINTYGQLGDGTTTTRTIPTQIGSGANWAHVTAGYYYTLALKTDGTLWAWGRNSGNLGDATTVDKLSPVQIGIDTDWASVAAHHGNVDAATGLFRAHSLALKTNGTLWAWGVNSSGQLGDGTTTTRASPVAIAGTATWTSISVGTDHSIAIKSDGTLWAWGANTYGQLGTASTYTPVQVGTASWLSVAAGRYHTVAVKSDGSLYGWGQNTYGQVGDTTTVQKTTPTLLSATTDWATVSAGYYQSFGRKTDGTLWAWGLNTYGQLGDGTTSLKSSPTQIGSESWTSVVAGGGHTLGVKASGLSAWGYNFDGQLGLGVSGREQNKLTPVPIAY